MKYAMLTTALLPFVLTTAVSAQETNQTAETPPASTVFSGLQIEGPTDQERIDFLSKVATAYFREGDAENAINAYERMLEIDPKNRVARFTIGHVYITAKRYAEAETLLIQLIDEFPDNYQLKNNLAWLYATAEDPAFRKGDESIRLAQEAIAISPNEHQVWSTLAEAYYVTGDYEKAYRAIEQMARLVVRYGMDANQQTIDGYNEQLTKCRRAWETHKALKADSDEAPDAGPATEPTDSGAPAASVQ